MRRTPDKPISREEALTLARGCVANAEALLTDAKLLVLHDRHRRGIFLALTALEEMSKATLLVGSILGEREVDWKKFWKYFRNHEPKISIATRGAAHHLGTSEATLLLALYSLRERCLYVERDRRAGYPFDPEGLLNHENALEILVLAQRRLDIEIELFSRPDERILNPEAKPYDPADPRHREEYAKFLRGQEWSESFQKPKAGIEAVVSPKP